MSHLSLMSKSLMLKQNNTERFWLHGDLREDGTAFCRRCDLFVDCTHFATEHPKPRASDPELYERSLAHFKQGRLAPARFIRPADAPNLFANERLSAERRPRQRSRSSGVGVR